RRARASAPITVGRASSHTSTTSTTAAVPSARPMSSASAGGAREEDHAVSVARDLGEVLDELRLPAPAGRAGRHGRPHAGVELAPERLDQLALLLGDVHVALGEHDLAVPRLHPQQPHLADYDKRAPATDHLRRRPARSIASTGPAPAPSSRSPRATASPARARALRAACSSVSPSASDAASAAECVQPEPCAAPSGWRGPSIARAGSPEPVTSRSVAL